MAQRSMSGAVPVDAGRPRAHSVPVPNAPSATRAGSSVLAATALTVLACLVSVTAAPAAAIASPAVTCTYTVSTWNGGFVANLAVANDGPTIDGWTVHWTFDTPTRATTVWSASLAQADPYDAVATPTYWNRVIRTGGVVSFGWTAIAATTTVPTDLTVNGQRC